MSRKEEKAVVKKDTKPYQLYQLKSGEGNGVRVFMGYDYLKQFRLKVEPSRYRKVYQGETHKRTTLDSIFDRFNRPEEMPSDYMARSLSVSDLIVMDGRAWYVDSFGFRDVTEEVGGLPLDTSGGQLDFFGEG